MQHHPCAEPHSGEVFYVGAMTGDNSAVPTEDQVFDYVGPNCLPAFETYTGETYDGVVQDVGFFRPTDEGWGDGDRGVICYVYNVDESTSTGSVKATP